MARTSSKYSGQVIAVPTSTDVDFPSTLTIERLWSGIKITWTTFDLGFDLIRIVRKVRDYGYNANDGVVVYEGAAGVGTFSDTSAIGPEVYYYVLWFRDLPTDPWETRYWTKLWEFALPPNTMPELLWKLLPSMYRNIEEYRDSSIDMNLHVSWMMAPIFREIEGLIQFFPQLLDVDNTPGPYLRAIAQYVGLVPNLELTYTQQREEIKAAVSSYKSKGLLSTLERMATAISGVPATVVDYNQQILFRDWSDKIRLDLSDPLIGYNFLEPGDTTYKRPTLGQEGLFDFATYGVYLSLGTAGLEERTVAKLYRSLGDFAPCYSSMSLSVQFDPAVEQYDMSTEITETSWIELEHYPSNETVVVGLILRDNVSTLRDDTDFTRVRDWPADGGSVALTT